MKQWGFSGTKILGAPLGYYAVIEGYACSRRDTVEQARKDLDRAIDILDHSTNRATAMMGI